MGVTPQSLTEKRVKTYIRAKAKGMRQKEAGLIAGYSAGTNPSASIEKSIAFAKASKTFKEAIARRASKDEVIGEMFRNAYQNEDKGAKNTALKMIADRYEPESAVSDTENKILMVFGADFEKPKQLEEPKD